MKIPNSPKPISIAIEFAINKMNDLNAIDQHIEEYSRLGWVLEERGMKVNPYNDFYTYKVYIKLTRYGI